MAAHGPTGGNGQCSGGCVVEVVVVVVGVVVVVVHILVHFGHKRSVAHDRLSSMTGSVDWLARPGDIHRNRGLLMWSRSTFCNLRQQR